MVAEAAAHPGGWVYEIDERYERDGAIPSYAVIRGWEVDSHGKLTGKSKDNPGYGVRKPLHAVEQVLTEAKAQSTKKIMELLVAPSLTVSGGDVSFDVGITIITDKVLGMGFTPAEDTWRSEIPGGFSYRWHRA